MSEIIWWIRRDLRLFDNPALYQALNEAEYIIPLFIMDEKLWQSPYMSSNRIAFMLNGLHQLAESLVERGGRLIIRHGRPLDVLRQFVAKRPIKMIYAQEDYSPYATTRDQTIARELPLTLTFGTSIRPVGVVLKNDGDPYTVYAPFKNKWLSHPLPRANQLYPAPKRIKTPSDIHSDEIPAEPVLDDNIPFVAGETTGREMLHQFITQKIGGYDDKRDQLAENGTSSLSPYLRFGMISAREAAVLALEAKAKAKTPSEQDGAQTWLEELIWRDFYMSILHYFPHVRQGSFRPEYDDLQWRNNLDEFAAWCNGRTGYPVVDAAMRQLNTIGWMHNRARMIVASFLIKDLLIDWRWGEKYFMQQLVDGDPAANNGGWQWTAGTGTDAAPYFRIFNPISQSKKYDPNGQYIRQWIPELKDVPNKYIHAPWEMPPIIQKTSNCIIGQNYPRPLIDHKTARQHTLETYKAVRN
ncbi:MAG: deoxyribodipyrimidine photo-lyase [Anaerolineales bacterium]|nr:deoxyribodipyrimidine photo-lyase [Anaerolineales bacterium]